MSTAGVVADEAVVHRRLTWQVKASTRCNLRCRYCYEWDRLDGRERLTVAQWRLVLEAIATHRAAVAEQRDCGVRTHVVLHGGEPLLLPLAYLQEVFGLHREELPGERLSIQTNLSVLGEALLEWLRREDVLVGVSWDGITGARADRAGRSAERRTFDNMQRLRASNVTFGVTLVLGAHNYQALPAIYDQAAAVGARWLTVVPVFARGGDPRGTETLLLSHEAAFRALAGLFDHWVRSGRTLTVEPIRNALRTIDYRRAGGLRATIEGTRFVVHPNGDLSVRPGEIGRDAVIGNLLREGILEILTGDRYVRELARAERQRRASCAACGYRGACDASPVLRYPHRFAPGPCPVAAPLLDYIDRSLNAAATAPAAGARSARRSLPAD